MFSPTLPNPTSPIKSYSPMLSFLRPRFEIKQRFFLSSNLGSRVKRGNRRGSLTLSFSKSSEIQSGELEVGDDSAAMELFESLKNAERERIDKLEKLESKSNMQLERQLMMASTWSRTLLKLQGKLKGTEWDPENSHKIDSLTIVSSGGFSILTMSSSWSIRTLVKPYPIIAVFIPAAVDILLEKGEIKADIIWNTFKTAPRIPQPPVHEVDEYGALIHAGRWGIHGVSLPGRVTFAPGNVGFSTFGAPRPMETQIISDDTWKLVDDIWDKRIQEIKTEVTTEIEEEEEKPVLLMHDYFL